MKDDLAFDSTLLESAVRCPVSHLPVLHRPEWTRVAFGKEYEITLSVIGESILLSQPSGVTTHQNIKAIMSLNRKVVAESPLCNRPFVMIEDFSRHRGASIRARKYYIDFMKRREGLVGVIYFGSSPAFSLSIKLGRHITSVAYDVQIVSTYEEAIGLALQMLGMAAVEEEAGRLDQEDPLPERSLPGQVFSAPVTQPDWFLDFGHSSLQFELLSQDVLLGRASGYFQKQDIEAALELHKQIIQDRALTRNGAYFYILDLNDARGITWTARKRYIQAIREMQRQFPLKKLFFCGANRVLKAGINIARPFVSFPVQVVDVRSKALTAITNERSQPGELPEGSPAALMAPPLKGRAPLTAYVEEMLQFLGGIDWESGTEMPERRMDPSHPFSPIYDALELIKTDLDEIARDRNRVEEELRKQNLSLKLLSQVSQELNSFLDLEQILDTLSQSTGRLTHATGSAIWLVDPESGKLVCRRVAGPYRESALGWRLAPGEGVAGRAAQKRECLLVEDTRNHPRYAEEFHRRTLSDIRSALCVPLLLKGELLGVLEVVDAQSERFDETVRDWVQTLAGSAAIAIENARLFGVAEKEIADRKQAERSLKETDAKYRTILNNATVGIMVIQDNKVCYFNRKVADLTGYDPGELLNMGNTPFIEWIHPADRPMVMDRYLRRQRGEHVPSVYAIRIIRKDADSTWVDISSSMITWEGKPATLTFMADISERKLAEASLKESETRFKDIATLLPTTIVELDAKGNLLYTNQAGFDTFGYAIQDLETGLNLSSFLYEKDHRRASRIIERTMRTPESTSKGEFTLLHRDGTEIPCYIQARALMRQEKPCGIRATLTDMGEMIRSKKALEESEEKYRNILESIQEGYYEVDLQGNFTFVNHAMTRILGFSKSEMLGMNNRRYMNEEMARKIFRLFNQVYTAGAQDRAIDLHLIRKDGTPITAETSLSLIRDRKGHRIGFRGIARDTTEKRRTEALELARKRAEAASQAKGEFLARMSHEIRTPLNAIIGMGELAMDTELNEHQRKILRTIQSESNALLNLINRVLDFAKIEADRLKLEEIPFDLRYLMEDVTNGMAVEAANKGLDLILFIPPGVPTRVIGDPGRLRQALSNLLGNAMKFTFEGEIVVTLAVEADRGEKTRFLFRVRDTGIGIPKEKQSSIFDPFIQADGSTTRMYGGTGLGTTIAKSLIELMGGEIGLESVEREGSTFWFTVELKRQPRDGQIRKTRHSDLKGKKVLIVDDNPTHRSALSSYLTSWGCIPLEVDGLGELWSFCKQLTEPGDGPAVILADLTRLPRSGMELVSAIKTTPALAGVPVIVLSSIGLIGDGKRCRDLGVQGYLTKPVYPGELYQVIVAVLGLGTDERERRGAPLMTRHILSEWQMDRSLFRILLTEDYPTNQYLAMENLRNAGFQVDLAQNGLEAVTAFQKVPYDLIFMDIQMPVMDGYEATRLIREQEGHPEFNPSSGSTAPRQRVPIIAMTAHAFEGYRQKCLDAGMDDYLAKPIRRKSLLTMAEKWLSPIGATRTVPASTPTAPDPKEHPDEEVREPGDAHAFQDVQMDQGGPPIDLEQALEEFLGKKDLLWKVVKGFRETVHTQFKTMEEALSKGDMNQMALEAHAIKGGAANLTADALSEAARVVEMAARDGEVEGLSQNIEDLRKEFQRLERYLDKEFQNN